MAHRVGFRSLLTVVLPLAFAPVALANPLSETVQIDTATQLRARLSHNDFPGGSDNHGSPVTFTAGLANWSIVYSFGTVQTPPPREDSFGGSVTIRHLVPTLGPLLTLNFDVPFPITPPANTVQCVDIPVGPITAAHGADTDELELNVHYCARNNDDAPNWATSEITNVIITIDGLHISSSTTTTTIATTTTTSSTIATTTTSTSTSTSSSTSTSTSTTSSTSTSSSSTSTSTTSSTSTSSSSTSSTSTSTSTSTTTSTVCDCDQAFQSRRRAKFNNDAEVRASVSVNDPGGLLVLGKNVTMPDGTLLKADRVWIGNASNVYGVITNDLKRGQDVTIRDGSGLITPPTGPLPLQAPFCTIPAATCGGPDVVVPPNTVSGPLAPGTYGNLYVMNGAQLTLSPGTFTVCNLRVSHYGRLFTDGITELNVTGGFKVDNGARFEPLGGTPTPVVNVGGTLVRIGPGAFVQAAIRAPNATVAIGRGGELLGCFCAAQQRSDKHPIVECTSSPSGAFLD